MIRAGLPFEAKLEVIRLQQMSSFALHGKFKELCGQTAKSNPSIIGRISNVTLRVFNDWSYCPLYKVFRDVTMMD